MSGSIMIAAATTADLEPSPISPDWILEGKPVTRSKELGRSKDRTSYVMVWDCTAGRFNWHYNKDETLVVVSGDAVITDERGRERRIGPGDIVFFPAGSSARWHVAEYIKKVAFLRHTMPSPMGLAVLAWNKLLRIVGWWGHAPLVVCLLAGRLLL
ncbi:MAG TPA: cupin domain-containing protein [Candidatus Bathyarchaeia archaeon]|nr:cupin domain-containing protein [Candidatus Bathyarchaeia archaeon]